MAEWEIDRGEAWKDRLKLIGWEREQDPVTA